MKPAKGQLWLIMARNPWIELHHLSKARVLLILPCNAAACIGNYFRAEAYSPKGWNTWREADVNLQELRKKGLVAFAAVDSSTLETQPDDPRGAIVLETEMERVRNPEGEDWGAPSWRWFKPTASGKWGYLEELTEALARGVRRIEEMGFSQVMALVNPRGYFLALAAAASICQVIDQWVLFRVPAHPRWLIPEVRQVAPQVHAAAQGKNFAGGIYAIPDFLPALRKEDRQYRHPLPQTWREYALLPSMRQARRRWEALTTHWQRGEDHD